MNGPGPAPSAGGCGAACVVRETGHGKPTPCLSSSLISVPGSSKARTWPSVRDRPVARRRQGAGLHAKAVLRTRSGAGKTARTILVSRGHGRLHGCWSPRHEYAQRDVLYIRRPDRCRNLRELAHVFVHYRIPQLRLLLDREFEILTLRLKPLS